MRLNLYNGVYFLKNMSDCLFNIKHEITIRYNKNCLIIVYMICFCLMRLQCSQCLMMGSFQEVNFFSVLKTTECDAYRRHILTSKDDPRIKKNNGRRPITYVFK